MMPDQQKGATKTCTSYILINAKIDQILYTCWIKDKRCLDYVCTQWEDIGWGELCDPEALSLALNS